MLNIRLGEPMKIKRAVRVSTETENFRIMLKEDGSIYLTMKGPMPPMNGVKISTAEFEDIQKALAVLRAELGA